MSKISNILIGTPAYNGQLHVDYLHSLLNFTRAGIVYSVVTISNESLITRARNCILATFDANTAFTHLLFLDADVYLDAQGLAALIAHDKDIVAAPVYLKGRDENGKQTLNTDADPDQLPVLQSVKRVGTAALMLSRDAVDALIQHAISEDRVYESNKLLEHPEMPTTHYDVFRVGISEGSYLSEDFWICKELRNLGFDIFVDTSAYTRHNGMVAFD